MRMVLPLLLSLNIPAAIEAKLDASRTPPMGWRSWCGARRFTDLQRSCNFDLQMMHFSIFDSTQALCSGVSMHGRSVITICAGIAFSIPSIMKSSSARSRPSPLGHC